MLCKLKYISLILIFGFFQEVKADFFLKYEAPLIPFSFIISNDGISLSKSLSMVTKIGEFGIGYSHKYGSDEVYTLVTITNLNNDKKYLYKIKKDYVLKLSSKGSTKIEISDKKVDILLEKGIDSNVSFELTKIIKKLDWISPKKKICRKYRGTYNNGRCTAKWKNAQKICSKSDGILPELEDLKNTLEDNSHQNFSEHNWYWTREEKDSYYVLVFSFRLTESRESDKTNKYYFECIKD